MHFIKEKNILCKSTERAACGRQFLLIGEIFCNWIEYSMYKTNQFMRVVLLLRTTAIGGTAGENILIERMFLGLDSLAFLEKLLLCF